ncbi:LuxR C-terminal-related transcriptional regulator [Streptomyces bobili]|uniref:LuxR C-terminal-related transcriptional regulator n=1 Tax=Streptomyces bobili TaxID=67280 RepID=UPI003811A28C
MAAHELLSRFKQDGVSIALFIEEYQALDTESRLLIQQLVNRREIRLIALSRQDAELASELYKPGFLRIYLAPLTPSTVGQVLRAFLGGPLESQTLTYLSAISAGNLTYLAKIIDGALESGQLLFDGYVWNLKDQPLEISAYLLGKIRQQLVDLNTGGQQLLELLAICENVGIDEARSITSPAELLKLESTGIVQVRRSGRRIQITLTHPLYANALADRIEEGASINLLLEHAERLSRTGMRRAADIAQHTRLILKATGTADRDRLMQSALYARRESDHKLALLFLQSLPDSDMTGETLLMLGEASHQLGLWREADKYFCRSQDVAASADEFIEALMERSQNALFGIGSFEQAMNVNRQASPAHINLSDRIEIDINRAGLETMTGGAQRTLPVLEYSGRASVPRVRLWGYAARVLALAVTGQTADAIHLGQLAKKEHEAYELNKGSGPSMPATAQAAHLILAHTERGEFTQARSLGRNAIARATDREELQPRMLACFHLGRSELIAGRLQAARDLLLEARSLTRHHHYPVLASLAGSYLLAVEGQLGSRPSAKEPDKNVSGTADYLVGENAIGTAWFHHLRDDTPTARSVLSEAADLAHEAGYVACESWLLAELVRMGGNSSAVRERLGELADRSCSPLYHLRSLLADALASRQADELMKVSELLHAAGLDASAAEASMEGARLWNDAGQPRQSAAATRQATEYARRCGLRCSPLISGFNVTPSLTAREKQIARLAADGLSSNSIANHLVISVRTVNNHLQSVYAKLGITTRDELRAIEDIL